MGAFVDCYVIVWKLASIVMGINEILLGDL